MSAVAVAAGAGRGYPRDPLGTPRKSTFQENPRAQRLLMTFFLLFLVFVVGWVCRFLMSSLFFGVCVVGWPDWCC